MPEPSVQQPYPHRQQQEGHSRPHKPCQRPQVSAHGHIRQLFEQICDSHLHPAGQCGGYDSQREVRPVVPVEFTDIFLCPLFLRTFVHMDVHPFPRPDAAIRSATRRFMYCPGRIDSQSMLHNLCFTLLLALPALLTRPFLPCRPRLRFPAIATVYRGFSCCKYGLRNRCFFGCKRSYFLTLFVTLAGTLGEIDENSIHPPRRTRQSGSR